MPPQIVLGQLERAVMDHLWRVERADVKEAWKVVGRRRKVTHNTVQSTMDRLYKKGLLDREKVSHAFIYSPALSRAAFRARMIREVAESVSDAETEMLAAFVDVAAEVGDETLNRLAQLIADKRAAEEDA